MQFLFCFLYIYVAPSDNSLRPASDKNRCCGTAKDNEHGTGDQDIQRWVQITDAENTEY